MTILVAALVYATGCGKSSSEVTNPPASAWTPDPNLVDQLKQTGNIGDYRLSLPLGFTALPVPAGLSGNTKLAIWKGTVKAGEAPSSLSVAVISDEKAVNETKNMRQFLVNYSAGFTYSVSIKISKRENAENGELGGIGFSRFRWSGTATNGAAVQGLAYGAIDNGRLIGIVAICSGATAEAQNKLMETTIATFKRR